MMEDMLDELARMYCVMYFWPYFLIGNVDNLKELSSNLCKPYGFK
jgi:hypothetical protein